MSVSERIARLPAPWLAAVVALSAAPALKIGDVALVEIAQLAFLALAVPQLMYAGFRIPYSGPWRAYGPGYFLFLCLCAAVSILAFRLPFYPPPGISLLKQPGVLSLARLFELLLTVWFMLAVAATLRGRRPLLRFALDLYCWMAVVSACASVGAWLLARTAGVQTILVYGPENRVRGFFNEGGPYGIFLVSAALALLLRARVFPPRYTFSPKAALCCLFPALYLSGSKAGLLAAAGVSAAGVLAAGSRAQKIALVAACSTVLVAFLWLFEGKLFGYAWSYLNIEEALYWRPNDPNLIMGRIAGALIAPRMIATHPLSGIGVGNYSLMRNDPEYLQDLPPVDAWDLSGVGLLGAAAEFGVPAAVFLLALLLRPMLRARKRKEAAIVAVTAAFQPVAFLVGVNLNFFYPWLMAAFVLALEP